jgi:hypothetical protein
MSTSQTLRIKFALPQSVHAASSNYQVQFSVEREDDGSAIFYEKTFGPSDLVNGALPNEKIASISRSSIPGFRDASQPVSLKVTSESTGRSIQANPGQAHIWMGQKFIESIDCGAL